MSYPFLLHQNQSSCEAVHIKKCWTYMFIFMQIKLVNSRAFLICHEHLAREIGQPLPTFTTLNKVSRSLSLLKGK